MKACSALFLCAAFVCGALFTVSTPSTSAQKVAVEDESGQKVDWGDTLELKDGQVVDIKAGLKEDLNFTYNITTRGSSEARVGKVGVSSEVVNDLRVKLFLTKVNLTNPRPDEEAPIELDVKFQRLSSTVNSGGKSWGFYVDQANSISKQYIDGEEVQKFEDYTGRPNASTLQSNMAKSLAFARVGEGNALTNLAHGAFWEKLPRDLPASIVDPIAFLRFLVPQIGLRSLTVSNKDGKLGGGFEVMGVELPVEIAKGRTALYDLKFTLTGARGGEAKAESNDVVDGEVGPDGKPVEKKDDEKKEAKEEIRFLSFDLVATPQPGQTVSYAGLEITPAAFKGTMAIDPRTGMLAEADLRTSFTGKNNAKGTMHIRISLLDHKIE